MSQNMLSLDFENHAVRIVTSESGEKLFVGKDVCEVLGYADPTTAMRSHCKGVQILHPVQTAGGVQEMRVITRSDVMRLICGSTLPAAVRFDSWVFDEILPSIADTGSYVAPNAIAPQPLPTLSDDQIEQLVVQLAPKLRLLDVSTRVTDLNTGMTSTVSIEDLARSQFGLAERFKRLTEMSQAFDEQLRAHQDYTNDLMKAINAQAEMLQFAYQQMFNTEDYREALAQPRFHTHQQLLSELLGRVSRLEEGSKKTNKRVAKLEIEPSVNGQ